MVLQCLRAGLQADHYTETMIQARRPQTRSCLAKPRMRLEITTTKRDGQRVLYRHRFGGPPAGAGRDRSSGVGVIRGGKR